MATIGKIFQEALGITNNGAADGMEQYITETVQEVKQQWLERQSDSQKKTNAPSWRCFQEDAENEERVKVKFKEWLTGRQRGKACSFGSKQKLCSQEERGLPEGLLRHVRARLQWEWRRCLRHHLKDNLHTPTRKDHLASGEEVGNKKMCPSWRT